MKQSEQIKAQIILEYTYEKILYANYQDIAEHLKDDRIDNNKPALSENTGWDSSYDNSLHVFYYEDKSALVVNSSSGMISI